ncbi:MAG: hypothetical protein R3Y44_04285 [Rikenellaceae bacterium]
MKSIIYRLLLLCLTISLSTNNSYAQTVNSENQSAKWASTYLNESDLWSVDLSIGAVQAIIGKDITAPYSPLIAAGAARQFSPLYTFRLNLSYGGLTRRTGLMSSIFSGGVDYLFNFSALNSFDENRKLNLYGVIGESFAVTSGSGRFKNFNVGARIEYATSNQISIFAEPALYFYDDGLDYSTNRRLCTVGNLKLGASYRFGSGLKLYQPSAYKDNIEELENRLIQKERMLSNLSEERGGLHAESHVNASKLTEVEQLQSNVKSYYNLNKFDNTFVALSAGSNYLHIHNGDDSYKNYTTTIALQYGKWFSPLYAIQANLSTDFNSHDIFYGTLSAEFMLNVGYWITQNIDQDISIIPITGLGIGLSPNTSDDDYGASPYFTCALQARYKINSQFDAYIEPRLHLFNSNLISSSFTSNRTPGAGIKIGFAYKLNSSRFTQHAYTDAVRAGQIQRRTNEIDQILTREKELRDSENAQAATVEEATSVKAVKLKQMSLYISFASHSSYIDSSQSQKLNIIGEWLQSNPNGSIQIISFSEDGYQTLNQERSEAIERFLATKYDLPHSSFSIVEPEEAGYANVNSTESIIIFNLNE